MTSSTVGPSSDLGDDVEKPALAEAASAVPAGDQPATHLDHARDDWKDLGLVDVGTSARRCRA